jgi:hypothetical protein
MVSLASALLVASCGQNSGASYTLYRNSPLDPTERVHWASFDANESGDYNRGNCMMAARLLNANVAASAKAEGKEPYDGVGFWCELGAYKEKGVVPATFEASYPANSDSPLSWK